jgi:hypothetical protein
MLLRGLLRRSWLPRLPGVAIGGSEGIGPDRAELAEPLLSRDVGAVVGRLAIIPPPAHRYLHTAYRENRRADPARPPGERPTGQQSHAREGAATYQSQLARLADRPLACGFSDAPQPITQIQMTIRDCLETCRDPVAHDGSVRVSR